MALALVCATLIIVALLAERFRLSQEIHATDERSAHTKQLALEVRLSDQRLSVAAEMAVATGDGRFVQEYDAESPRMIALLAEAKRLAPDAAADRFEAKAGEADAALSDMRNAAIEAISVGEVSAAMRIFQDDRFKRYTALLSSATTDLTVAAIKAAQHDGDALRLRATGTGTGIAVLAGTLLLSLGLWHWHWLTVRLERSRTVLGDAAARIQRLATTDLLTGLGNRVALHDAMTTSLARLSGTKRRLMVLIIDLDRFKPVNDRHGHAVGDRVLKEVSLRLAHCLRGGELKARYGGDEFVLQSLGCRLGQGYLFSRPIPAAEIEALAIRSAALPAPVTVTDDRTEKAPTPT